MARVSLSFASSTFIAWKLAVTALAADSPQPPGKIIYDRLCSECHGDRGQGVQGKYDDPLTGNKPVEALARKIEKTMPEDHEDECVGEDAKAVAAYIYDAFYSPVAQARINPPAKDIARLTAPQVRNSVMDLIGRFRMGPGFDRPLAGEPGLKATYKGVELPKPGQPAVDTTPKGGIKMKRPNKTIEAVEPGVAFHWGADSPRKEVLESEQFQNRFEGCIIAPETGTYEFAVKSENGFRLWINATGDGNELIDGWVTPGPDVREEKRSLFLVGGRGYRLQLDHFKFKEKSASLELLWKPPHGVWEPIPAHVLRTERPRELMIVSTAFPPDDRSVGYERGTTISKDWQQAITDCAISTAEHVVDHLDELAQTKAGAPDREAKLKKFAEAFVETAYRRPLTDEDKKRYVSPHFKLGLPLETSVKRVVMFALISPRFLYPGLPAADKADDYDAAQRLALTLWDSLPDKRLWQAASAGKLHTRDQVRTEAIRMVADPRTKAKLHGFFYQWLDLERAEGTAKDPKAFPGFDQTVLADLRESLLQFVDNVVWSDTSDYRELLKADYLLLNERLGKFYGKPVNGEEFQKVSFDPKQRAGIVTHPYLLASLASSKQTSPIQRGVFLTRNIVGMALKPPKMAVSFDESHFNPKLTMREKITELTKNNACMSCHGVINPLGFSLENFDAIGRWRTKDNNKPVDSVSQFNDDHGTSVRLTGPRDIVNYVADNPSGHRAFIAHLFNHCVKQAPAVYGPTTLDDLQKKFAANQCHIQKLLVDIAIAAAEVK
jgi:mono/diheme cytochrome c family protein